MAEVNVEELLQEFEREIGRLNGIIIRNQAAYRAELQQRQSELEGLLRQVQEMQQAQSSPPD